MNASNPKFLTLFRDIGEGTRNVFPRWFDHRLPTVLPEAFQEAAEAIVNAANESPYHPDKMFWPVALCYRHALELYFKEIIRIGSSLPQNSDQTPKQHNHDLKTMWQDARRILLQVWPGGGQEPLQPIDEAVQELDKFDHNGDAFRYSHTKKGKPHLAGLPERFSLTHLAGQLSECCAFLEACLLGIQQEIECRTEYEYYRNM